MSKAVLVIDMPKNCEGCRFSTIGCQDNDVCYLNNKEIYLDKKPDWCPLKPMPKKKPTIGKESENDILCMNAGYNACIDELLKGEEG